MRTPIIDYINATHFYLGRPGWVCRHSARKASLYPGEAWLILSTGKASPMSSIPGQSRLKPLVRSVIMTQAWKHYASALDPCIKLTMHCVCYQYISSCSRKSITSKGKPAYYRNHIQNPRIMWEIWNLRTTKQRANCNEFGVFSADNKDRQTLYCKICIIGMYHWLKQYSA